MRPQPGKWQGYDRPRQVLAKKPPRPVFDPRVVVLAITGQRLPLSATLKVMVALRDLLMRECRRWRAPRKPVGILAFHARGMSCCIRSRW